MIAVVLYVCVTIQFIFVCIMMPDAGMATTRRYHKVSAFFCIQSTGYIRGTGKTTTQTRRKRICQKLEKAH